MPIDKERSEQRFYRRLFSTISDHRRKIDELKQNRQETKSSKKFPNISLATLTFSDSTSSTSVDDRIAEYGLHRSDSNGDYAIGYDFGSYSSAGSRVDQFERSALGDSGGFDYRDTSGASIAENQGFGSGNAVEKTSGGHFATSNGGLGGFGRKITYLFRYNGSNRNRYFGAGFADGDNYYWFRLSPNFAVGYQVGDANTTLDSATRDLENGWYIVEMHHLSGQLIASLQRIMPRTNDRTHVTYLHGTHNNPVTGGTDLNVYDEGGGFYDRFVTV
jgi:hypothetical protein